MNLSSGGVLHGKCRDCKEKMYGFYHLHFVDRDNAFFGADDVSGLGAEGMEAGEMNFSLPAIGHVEENLDFGPSRAFDVKELLDFWGGLRGFEVDMDFVDFAFEGLFEGLNALGGEAYLLLALFGLYGQEE